MLMPTIGCPACIERSTSLAKSYCGHQFEPIANPPPRRKTNTDRACNWETSLLYPGMVILRFNPSRLDKPGDSAFGSSHWIAPNPMSIPARGEMTWGLWDFISCATAQGKCCRLVDLGRSFSCTHPNLVASIFPDIGRDASSGKANLLSNVPYWMPRNCVTRSLVTPMISPSLGW